MLTSSGCHVTITEMVTINKHDQPFLVKFLVTISCKIWIVMIPKNSILYLTDLSDLLIEKKTEYQTGWKLKVNISAWCAIENFLRQSSGGVGVISVVKRCDKW